MDISNGQGPHQVAHIDTYILLNALGFGDGLTEIENASRRIIFPSGEAPQAVVSFPALGEFVMVVQRDFSAQDYTDAMERLRRWMNRERLDVRAFGTDGAEAQRHALGLHEADYKLAPTDTIIIACALVDTDCSVLYMSDSIIGSPDIHEYIQDSDHSLNLKPP